MKFIYLITSDLIFLLAFPFIMLLILFCCITLTWLAFFSDPCHLFV